MKLADVVSDPHPYVLCHVIFTSTITTVTRDFCLEHQQELFEDFTSVVCVKDQRIVSLGRTQRTDCNGKFTTQVLYY